ncbi:MAG: 50S ribosomal protein L10 [Pirellulales bacterium]|nr:50S ribosomal protein L10 [Pirellulales bacterium]
MSKYVKQLMTDHLKQQLDGVENVVLVTVEGIEANANVELRRTLRQKDMQLLVVKNSIARRATEGTALAPAFEGLNGTAAVVWGGTDIVDVAKEVVRLAKEKQFEPFKARGGVLDGQKLSESDVVDVSKWPSRTEQLSILVGQILSPWQSLAGQLVGPSGALASQVKKKSEGESEDAAE